MRIIDDSMLSRRQVIGMGLSTASVLMLAACGGNAGGTSTNSNNDNAAQEEAAVEKQEEELVDEQEAPDIDATEYDKLIATGPVAEDAAIAASAWATKVKDAGKLRVGGVETSTFFGLKNVKDGKIRGFDAGLYQLLTRYITGDESNCEQSQVTSATRESLLTNDQVDAVFATYSITPSRQEVIDFAGPYYSSQQSILVLKDNKDIKEVDDLAGLSVAVQSESTGPAIVEDLVPDAVLQEFTTDPEARQALEQGRVDAYVIDNTMNMGSVARNPSKYKIVGEPFGPIDPYGIGLSKEADGAVDFINDFLKEIEASGLWAELWQVTIGDRIGSTEAPEPPEPGVIELEA